jgi:hypothetical protein
VSGPGITLEQRLGVASPDLVLFDQQLTDGCEEAFQALDQQDRLIAADTIPGVWAVRLEARMEAESIQESRMQLLREGEFESVPLDVDALSTAGRVLEAETKFGRNSEAYQSARANLRLDCERLFGEAYRRGAWEYFPEVEQTYDVQAGSYSFMGYSLDKMVAAGVTPLAGEEENAYRLTEFVEEKTYKALRRVGRVALGKTIDPDFELPAKEANADFSVITVSECSDEAITAYDAGKRSGFGGHVPEIKKLMIRGIRFNHATDSRFQEQLAVSGEHITHKVIVETLREQRAVAEDAELSKDEVRGKQLIDLSAQGAIGFLKKLDAMAGKMSGKRIFRGEVIPDHQPKDYEAIPAEAKARQQSVTTDVDKTVDYVLRLKRQKTDRSAAGGLLQRFIHNQLAEKVKFNPQAAEIAFNKETAVSAQLNIDLRAQGRDVEAERLWLKAVEEAPLPEYCGAGACGLVAVSTLSEDGLKAQKLGLDIKDPKDLLKDTERACPGCKKYKVFYDLRTGSKVCTRCDKTDLKK